MRRLKRSECAVLPLVLKGRWYDMIARGEKHEEYRDYGEYWSQRVDAWFARSRSRWQVVEFRRGYAANAPRMAFIVEKVRLRDVAVFRDWGEQNGMHFAIYLGERVELTDG